VKNNIDINNAQSQDIEEKMKQTSQEVEIIDIKLEELKDNTAPERNQIRDFEQENDSLNSTTSQMKKDGIEAFKQIENLERQIFNMGLQFRLLQEKVE